MAMTLPIPSSPSSTSADSPNTPRTPVSPTDPVQTLSLPPSDQSASPSPTNTLSNPLSSNSLQAKRKPSRRANTAERRATHNAVERQRRETLNGRFLVCSFFRLASTFVFRDLIPPPPQGSCRPPPQPFSDPPPFQVGYCQFLHCSHPCFSPPPCHGFP